MEQINLETLKFPIGKFKFAENISSGQIDEWIGTIERFPLKLIQLTTTISEEQLDWCYRPDGWSIRQVIHHCSDSHLNSLIRFKWALTEDNPTIKVYDQKEWANLPDSLDAPISGALTLLDGLHERWVYLLKNLTETDLKKGFVHPESGRQVLLEQNIGLYAWHCDHHYAHILLALEHEGKF